MMELSGKIALAMVRYPLHVFVHCSGAGQESQIKSQSADSPIPIATSQDAVYTQPVTVTIHFELTSHPSVGLLGSALM